MLLLDFLHGIRAKKIRDINQNTTFCSSIDPDNLSKMEFDEESENLSTSTSNNDHPTNRSSMVRKYVGEKLTIHNYRIWKT